MNNRNERRCTRPVDITTLPVEETQKACKAVCIKEMIIQLLTRSVTITQLDLYLQRTNDPFSFSLFSPPDNHLSIPLTLKHSPTLLHPMTPPPRFDHNTVTSPQLFPIGPSGDENETTRPFDWIMQGIPGETPPTLYVHSKTEYPISTVLPACCIRQKHG